MNTCTYCGMTNDTWRALLCGYCFDRIYCSKKTVHSYAWESGWERTQHRPLANVAKLLNAMLRKQRVSP